MIKICTLTCYQGVRKICLYGNTVLLFSGWLYRMSCLEIFFLFYVIDLDAVLYIYANHSVPWFNHRTFCDQKWLFASFDFSVMHTIA